MQEDRIDNQYEFQKMMEKVRQNSGGVIVFPRKNRGIEMTYEQFDLYQSETLTNTLN